LEAAMMADILPIPDRKEPASLIEPTRISEGSHHRVHLKAKSSA